MTVSSGVFGEQRVEPVDARAPDLFVRVQQRLSAPDHVGVCADDPLAAARALGHQTRPL